jgi:hypothetical protein
MFYATDALCFTLVRNFLPEFSEFFAPSGRLAFQIHGGHRLARELKI